jgi:GTP cyclohydrolase IA
MRHQPAIGHAGCTAEQPPMLRTFANDDGYDQLVLARTIQFQGLWEHHVTPVVGIAHIGYLPGELMLGLAGLGRFVDFFAGHAQSQREFTQQVAEHLATHLRPRGVGVLVEAEDSGIAQSCVRAFGPTSLTSALLGTLRTVRGCRAEFFALIGMSR